MPYGDITWKRIHFYYMSEIVPFIKNVHVDFRYRYDMWLHDPRSELPLQNALNFAKLIRDLQYSYFVSDNYRKCLDKINPFVQKKWADPKFNYKARVEENVIYF